MWTRAQLKEKGKKAFKLNYWKTLLVAIIAIGLLSSIGAGSGLTVRFRGNNFFNNNYNNYSPAPYSGQYPGSALDQLDDALDRLDDAWDWDDNINMLPPIINYGTLDSESQQILGTAGTLFAIPILLSIVFIAMIIAVLGAAIGIFLYLPLTGGAARFFLKNLGTRSEIKELAYNYDHGYLNTVKTLFLKSLFTFLWSLLLIIPGIIKSYEYRMIPYLLAENPELTSDEIFARSKAMMKGQKWNAFVLDLSFLGWEILSALTLGILGVFYVNPYRLSTNAALYEALAYGTNNEQAV